jgi:hypothetical protein
MRLVLMQVQVLDHLVSEQPASQLLADKSSPIATASS